MEKIITLFVVTLLSSLSLSAELKMSASYRAVKMDGRPFYEITYIVKVRNEGSSIYKIPTKLSSSDGYIPDVKVGISEKMLDGFTLVAPKSDLEIVELRPNEITLFSHTSRSRNEPEGDINLTYEISDSISKRYEIWSGSLSATAKQIQIPSNR